jgi:hypothetical protein
LTAAAIRRKQEIGGRTMSDDPKSRAIAVAEQLRARAAAKPVTDAQRKLLEHSAKIFDEPATTRDAAYLPRELVQVTLPHKNPGNAPAWERVNGNLTSRLGPVGTVPRSSPTAILTVTSRACCCSG